MGKASGQITIVDLNDAKQLSCFIASNLAKIQIEDKNGATPVYEPNWISTPLKLTPTVLLNNEAIPLNASTLSVTWKRKEGTGAEGNLIAGETATAGVLTVNQNKMATMTANQLTYLCYVTYTDPHTAQVANILAVFDFSLIKNADNARLASIDGESVFKYNTTGALVGSVQIALTANLQGVTVSKWQYANASGVWTDYPTTPDNANITGGILNVKPTHAVFFSEIAKIKVLTSDPNVYDICTITKLYDGKIGGTGATGGPGAPGADAVTIILTNEAQIIAATPAGACAATVITTKVIAYKGITKITPTLTTPTGLPSGMTATQATAGNEVTLTLTIAANATLGGVDTGVVNLTITADGKVFTKVFSFSKSKSGTNGTNGTNGINAIVFSIYAPNGSITLNGAGNITLATAAYNGNTPITSGATYQWAKYVGGTFTNISRATAATYLAPAADIVNICSYRCTMTYSAKTYVDVITVEDKTDSYTVAIDSTGGDKFKNGQGESIIIARLFQNGKEVDEVKTGDIGPNAPGTPGAGKLWYKVDKTAKTVVLQKYNGTAWVAATGGDLQAETYLWTRTDKDGNALDPTTPFKNGKVIFIDKNDVDVKTTFHLEVSE